jgi:hypothetical protein
MPNDAARAFSPYDDATQMRQHVAEGQHRAVIGGLWDELGSLQLQFLRRQGLEPRHTFIDVGAGSFRAGVKLVPYLETNNYHAIDVQESLLDAGYTREVVPAGLAGRFPRKNYTANAGFDVSAFQRTFDFGIAQSVFTHMPIARLGDCLAALAPWFHPGSLFFVTVFLVDDADVMKAVKHWPGEVVTNPGHDPFHTTISALHGLAARAPEWRMTVIGDWRHPRDQQMLRFARR